MALSLTNFLHEKNLLNLCQIHPLLLDLGITVEVLDNVEGVNATLVGPSLDINDAGMEVSGDMAFATIADTDLVN